MNESFKNSLKGFKVKGIFIIFAAFIIIVLAANAFNTGTGFQVACGIVAILSLITYVIVAIIKNKEQYEFAENAKIAVEKANAEKAAARKAFEKQIAQLEKERNDAEFQLAQEKAKNSAAQAVKEFIVKPEAEPKQQAKKKNTAKK